MGEVTIRPMEEADLRAARRVQVRALRWLMPQVGKEPDDVTDTDEPSPAMRHLLHTDPDLCWVAERDGLVGMTTGFVREDLWFLAMLFVAPDQHGQDIGQRLLRRSAEGGRRRGARVRAVAASPHLAAQALYVRWGMAPRFPLLYLQGRTERLLALPEPVGRVLTPDGSGAWARRLGDLDRLAFGRSREADHRLWLADPALRCRAVVDGDGTPLGYVYVTEEQVGPVAVRSPRLGPRLLHLAGALLAEAGRETATCMVPGANLTVLRALLVRGFQLQRGPLFMASRPFSRFDRYLPANGALL